MDPARFSAPGPSTVPPAQQPQPQQPQGLSAAAAAAAAGASRAPTKKRPRPSPDSSSLNMAAPPRTMAAPQSAGAAAVTAGAGDLSKVRAFAACRACRQKKVKCLPGPSSGGAGAAACQQCTLSGAECEYQPTRDRAAYSRAYVQDLSGRVQALEAVRDRILPLLAAFEGGTLNLAGLTAPTNAGALKAKEEPDDGMDEDKPPLGEGDEEDDQESRRFLTDERGNFRWIGASNTLSLLESFDEGTKELPSRVNYTALRDDPPDEDQSPPESHPYFAPVAGAGTVRAIPGVDKVTFPPRVEAEAMVDAFFSDVHPVLPVVLEPDFRRRFRIVMDKVDAGDFSTLSAGYMSVLFAVFALGERVIVTSAAWQRERAKQEAGQPMGETVQPGEAEAGVIWFERSQVLHFSSIREIDIHQVQCLTLLSAFQASVNAMPMSWLLASQALRIAQDIGLHRAAPRFKVSFKVKQLGARCWWAIYGLERLVSVTLGRPLCVDDLDIDVAYPAAVDDETIHNAGEKLTEEAGSLPEEPTDCTMSGFIALTKLCKIAGRVAQLLYRPSNGRSVTDPSWAEQQQRNIDKLDSLLRNWLEHEVPQKYKGSSPSRPVSLMSAVLSNSYFSILITLHRNLLPSNPGYPRPKPTASSQSLAHCVEAARSAIYVASRSTVLVPVSHHIAVFCQYLWSSAVILLLCEVRAKEQIIVDAVGAQVESCHRSLQALEPVWPGCHKLQELLTDVESRAKEVRANVIPQRPPKKQRKSTSAVETSSANAASATNGNGNGRRTSAASAASAPAKATTSPVAPAPPVLAHTLSASSSSAPYPLPTLQGIDANAFNFFDVGDMNFDGLEMLKAFTSEAWNVPLTASPLDRGTGTPVSIAAGGAGQASASPGSRLMGNNGGGPTPPALGSTAIPSPVTHTASGSQGPPSAGPSGSSAPSGPGASASAWFTHGLGPAAPSPAPAPSELHEMWAQITGASFDWQADPSVPFSI